MHYLYIASTGEVERESVNPFITTPPGYLQASNPASVTATLPPRVYDIGLDEIRAATIPEEAAFPSGRVNVSVLAARQAGKEILVITDNDFAQAIRGTVDALVDHINIIRTQINTTTAESNQLTNTAFLDIDKNTVLSDAGIKIEAGLAD